MSEKLEINTKLVVASTLKINLTKNERNIEICKRMGATEYFSGKGAKVYNDEEAYAREGIKIIYQDFKYPEYKQMFGEFIPNLSTVDLLFNLGPDAKKLFKKSRTAGE